MKQIIPFVKDISFNTRVSEITSIALEHNLQMENGDSLVGSFEVSGNYKINDVSVNEENFNYDIPFDITLDDKYDATKVTIDIDDFYYEIINDAILRVHIDVLADNLVYAPKEEPKEEIREENVLEPVVKEEILIEEALTDEKSERGEEVPEEREMPKLSDQIIEMPEEVKEEIKEIPRAQENITEEIKNSLAANFLADDEKYVTYKVHIVRENETIETIKETYNVTIEEIEKYNAIDNIMIGTKLLIPTSSNEQ